MRRAWRDVLGGLRTTYAAVAGEARIILAEADAPQVERPGFWRRAWRRFRRLPRGVQAAIGLALFAGWCWIVFKVWLANGGSPPRQPTQTGVTI